MSSSTRDLSSNLVGGRIIANPFKIPEQAKILPEILSWFVAACVIGGAVGTVVAGFMFGLEYVTNTRLEHPWLLYFLPLAGVAIAFIYRKIGQNSELGNDLLIDEIHDPKKVVPLRMAPLVLLGTWVTHLFGGSAGREGTAVQMGGALADQLTLIFKLNHERRKTLLMTGISAGFSAVFGTPLAGAVFGFEVLAVGRVKYNALLPCFTAAVISNLVCLAWGVKHTPYSIATIPDIGLWPVAMALVAGACFGLCAYVFSWASHRSKKFLKTAVPNVELRALIGGIVIIGLVTLFQTDRYLGLGIPVIQETFEKMTPSYDFLLKMIFTIVTLSSGFKGGEVTPLFFIGATLGNTLAWVLPLPSALLAGMGFVAVFAGAANTPLACMLMAFEIFGPQAAIYTALACVASYVFSGHAGIYQAQRVEVEKHVRKN